MRSLLAVLLCVPACTDAGGSAAPDAPDPGDACTGTATFLTPTTSSSPSLLVVGVQWSAALPGAAVHVSDQHGNDFTTKDEVVTVGNTTTGTYQLPAGRTITAEAGFFCEATHTRKVLATKTFTVDATTPCDTPTLGYAATITQPARDAVLPSGLTTRSTFGYTFSPAMGIPDRYELLFDETDHHQVLTSVPGYNLARGHTFTFELGWYCLDETPEKGIPLAAVRFSTAP